MSNSYFFDNANMLLLLPAEYLTLNDSIGTIEFDVKYT